jgi:hypothetical protein
MKVLVMAVMATMLMAAAPAAADDSNAELVAACRETLKHRDDPTKDTGQSLWCLGSASGYTNMHDMLVALERIKPMWCVSDGVKLGQAIKVYVQWSQRNPDHKDDPAAMGWAMAMIEVFPCSQEVVTPTPPPSTPAEPKPAPKQRTRKL